MSKSKFYLGIGPLSRDIIDTVNEYKTTKNVQLMFIASENQINRDGGYTGFKTRDFTEYIKGSRAWKCRDHCGPGFFYKTKKECFETIVDDINNGFDLIHIDSCWLDGEDKLRYTIEAIELALSMNDKIKFEIGTEVNTSQNKLSPKKLKSYLDEILKITAPFFYVLETGSEVQGYNNSHNFNPCKESLDTLSNSYIKVKEHNADYIGCEEICQRHHIVNGMNVAPQLGVVQTSTVLNEALIYGIDSTEFKNLVYSRNKWVKWKEDDRKPSLDYASLLAGHYHFNTCEYKMLVDKICRHIDLGNKIKNNIKKVISHYISSYWSKSEI